jgi:hypothetical protein
MASKQFAAHLSWRLSTHSFHSLVAAAEVAQLFEPRKYTAGME